MTRKRRTCWATHSELLMDGQYVQICSIATQSSILLLSVYFFFYDHKRYQEVSPRIAWDALRICRLSLIFRFLLRPEMMVLYI